jgi:hypothetical protein
LVVHIRTRSHQHGRALDTAVLNVDMRIPLHNKARCKEDRRSAVSTSAVRVRAVVDQEPHHLLVPSVTGHSLWMGSNGYVDGGWDPGVESDNRKSEQSEQVNNVRI